MSTISTYRVLVSNLTNCITSRTYVYVPGISNFIAIYIISVFSFGGDGTSYRTQLSFAVLLTWSASDSQSSHLTLTREISKGIGEENAEGNGLPAPDHSSVP